MGIKTQKLLPREKIESFGVNRLSDAELLAVLLGSGNKKKSVQFLACEILPIIDQYNQNLSLDHLLSVDGIGKAKATLLLAALEFARRRIRPKGIKVKSMADIMPLISNYADRPQEHLICITLNGAQEVISSRVVTIGLVNLSHIHPREVFANAIIDRACSIIIAHNHPSGNLKPSKEDLKVTESLIQAGNILGITLLDHLIFTEDQCTSILTMHT